MALQGWRSLQKHLHTTQTDALLRLKPDESVNVAFIGEPVGMFIKDGRVVPDGDPDDLHVFVNAMVFEHATPMIIVGDATFMRDLIKAYYRNGTNHRVYRITGLPSNKLQLEAATSLGADERALVNNAGSYEIDERIARQYIGTQLAQS